MGSIARRYLQKSRFCCLYWEFVVWSPLESLYTFAVTASVLEEFAECVERNKSRYMDREFHSLEILKTLVN